MSSHRVAVNTSSTLTSTSDPPSGTQISIGHSFSSGDLRMNSHPNGPTQDVRPQRPARRGRRCCTSMLTEKKTRRRLLSLILCSAFLLVILSIYLACVTSDNVWGGEVHILLIFMILIIGIIFCHSLIRFVMALVYPPSATNRIPSMAGPAGYAQPDRPIHVTMTGDEESSLEGDGTARGKVAVPPPAYGLWRGSVRLNPDLIYWQRVDNQSQVSKNTDGPEKTKLSRPPSYMSDDGVAYVVEAQPRSFSQYHRG